MSNKSVPQLDQVTSVNDTDLLHLVVNNVDKKLEAVDLKSYVQGTSIAPTIYSDSILIKSVDVLNSNTTPIKLVNAAGAGKGIVILPSIVIEGKYNTTAYTTNLTMQVYSSTSTNAQYVFTNVLNFNTNRTTFGSQQVASSAANTQIIDNADVLLKTTGGNPLAGNSDIVIHFQYIIIDL